MTKLAIAKILIWFLGSAALLGSLHFLGLSSAANWIQWVTTFAFVGGMGAGIEKVYEEWQKHKLMMQRIHELHHHHIGQYKDKDKDVDKP